ncbi:MAG: holo-ACP synthase [Defluviitaleaceae bacterium]|nr:holo-ACP synthase [Defluviitaleaceae bacterium]
MIVGIGTDIVKTSRFKDMTEHFMTRVFTFNERAYIIKKGYVSAAGIFAAKEAVSKALGTGFNGFWPSNIEVSHDTAGKPYIILHEKAEQRARGLVKDTYKTYTVDLSISHTETDAVAFVVISAIDI